MKSVFVLFRNIGFAIGVIEVLGVDGIIGLNEVNAISLKVGTSKSRYK